MEKWRPMAPESSRASELRLAGSELRLAAESSRASELRLAAESRRASELRLAGSELRLAAESSRASESRLTSSGYGSALLPGIPNDITIAHIAPKLSWRDDYVLSSVTPAWRQAIRSRQVHDARVRCNSAETLVLVSYVHARGFMTIAMYCRKENSWYKLPILPHSARTMLGSKQYECASLDGKVYVLGVEWSRTGVYVFDVAGQRPWKQCASMNRGREGFGCAVHHGKIYAFGGSYHRNPVRPLEVYDTESDTWTLISPMLSLPYDSKVAVNGDDLLAGTADVILNHYIDNDELQHEDDDDEDELDFNADEYCTGCAQAMEAYLPATDQWRLVEGLLCKVVPESMRGQAPSLPFVDRGRLFSLTYTGVHVYNMDSKRWELVHSCSFEGAIPSSDPWGVPIVILPVGNELLALFMIVVHGEDGEAADLQEILFRTEGLLGANEELVWEKVEIPPPIANSPQDESNSYRRYFMSALQL